ncbi:aldo/keto reductase [Trueperella bialowiezensis]|uniref:L-glyceraldehyde 3-phosphate reductase n=1 Tax=Trueperella bialowiezensis TaxID=312285 RepID=A0A448PDR4_9ACTO|nr:aldo/keto reductase [Trueperella bialowiezensis]VEI13055.1 L-glyceraldehyde 3-phosphate reductase [Trueperella bialowiezensis]
MKPQNFQPSDDFWTPAASRYDDVPIVPCGNSGLHLPRIALGLWHNFGDDRPFQTQRDIVRYAFDRGVIHFDLANNYGPPAGSAEENFGRIIAKDLRPYRHEIVISTKAGWNMWRGPMGFGGSRNYLLTSLDESLARMGVDYVDIFYHHRPDPDVPLAETMLALHDAVRSGKARYAGISSYSASATKEAQAIMRELGTPLVIHQPSYSMLNRWVEDGEPSLLDSAAAEGMGVIAFSPLAQGMLTDKYLNGVPEGSRLDQGKVTRDYFTDEVLGHVRALNEIAAGRGQTLAQMAIAWILRDQGERTVTTALVGASSVDQLADSLGAVENTEFSAEELAQIDEHAVDSGINSWWGATQSRA